MANIRRVALACAGFCIAFAAGEASAAIPASERAALIALYDSTNGPGWFYSTNWLNASGTECTWYGVTCDASGNHVTGLLLCCNMLSGTVPPEIGSLTQLIYLNLTGNGLSGSIPPEIGNLTELTFLSLSDNRLLSGNLDPYELILNGNQLSGSIPPQVGNLTRMIELDLDGNELSELIPSEIGNLKNLRVLHLDSNQLTGAIPTQIGGLSNLYSLYLSNNQLSGSIPSQVGNLADLEYLYLSNNQLSGPIPPQIGNLTRLSVLDMSNNQLTGPIPTQIGSLPLFFLGLSHNHLSGPIPAWIGNFRYSLFYLDLGGNRLSGPIPPQIGNLTYLLDISLNGNQLSGPLPATLVNLTNLRAGESDLRWNALHTSDPALRAFLDSKQIGGDWESTQTVAPPGLAAGTPGPASVPLSWTPILYTSDTGGYRIWYGTTPGGPYDLAGTTADKTVSASAVSGLSPGTIYYFVTDTQTSPHGNNQNTVVSERTAEVSATTTTGGLTWVSLNVTRSGPGTVSSSPGGIECGGVCTASYAPGTPLTLTAVPDAGSAFLGWGGACSGSSPTCDLTMDTAQTVTASFSSPAVSYYTVTPCRVFDSRDAGLGGPAALAAGTANAIMVGGYCGIPATAKAVSLNVTVVSPSTGGHLQLYASGTPRPTTSSVNYAASQTRANNAVVSLGADGSASVYVKQPSGTAQVVIDVNGYFQ